MAALTQTRWQRGRVAEVEEVAEGVRRIVLEPEHPVPAAPGTHVDVDLGTEHRTRTRSYSVVRSEDGGARLTLSVQLARQSRGGSRHMHTLRAGDEIAMTEPVQSFPLSVGASRYVLVAGGIGVTALVAMASALRRRGADYQVVLVGRSRRVMAYAEDLVAEHGDRVRLHVDDEGTPLDVAALVAEVAEHAGARHTELYMCGPIGLMDAIRGAWTGHLLPEPNLRFETFGSSGTFAAEEFVVRIPQFGREIAVGPETTMLDALEDAGLDVMSDCRKGECGLCLVKVLDVDGQVDHRDVFLSRDQKERSAHLCLCVSRAVAGADANAKARTRSNGNAPAAVTVLLP
ncbi:PDR/VanB family oxidoreductase [Nocardioides insulae]|uniref:PDR/VanB family oxidoreductase n=1 Tax=Nocardioides insulae TaxID=394734 RepID=UPI0003F909A4|nr:PDR/VanB family oxidoreductase [Nocardioides insulae]